MTDLLLTVCDVPAELAEQLRDVGLVVEPVPEDLATIDGRSVAGVFTLDGRGLDRARITAEKLGLPYYSREQLEVGCDKRRMKERLRGAGIEVADFAFFPSDAPPEVAPFPYPFVVKPNQGYASVGVRLVHDDDELEEAFDSVEVVNMMLARGGAAFENGVLCERFIQGPEFSVESLTVDGETRALLVCDRAFPGPADFRDHIYKTHPEIGASFGRTPEQLYSELEPIVADAVASIGVRWGPSHAELRYDVGRERWVLLEVGLRVGGGGRLGRVYEAATGHLYNVHAAQAVCRRLSREELRAMPRGVGRCAANIVVPAPRMGRLRAVHGTDLQERMPEIHFLDVPNQPGDRIVPPPEGFDRVASLVASHDDPERLDEVISIIMRELRFEYA